MGIACVVGLTVIGYIGYSVFSFCRSLDKADVDLDEERRQCRETRSAIERLDKYAPEGYFDRGEALEKEFDRYKNLYIYYKGEVEIEED